MKVYALNSGLVFLSNDESGGCIGTGNSLGTFYVRSDGDNSADGISPDTAFRNVEHALERIAEIGAPWTVIILDSFTTDGEMDVPDNTTIIGSNYQRRTIVRPNVGKEVSNVFRVGNGCHIINLKFTGWQIDSFSNPDKGFAMVFREGAVILPGGVPYAQNCTVSAVGSEVPTPLPMDARNGNPAQPKGGGCVMADASVLSPYSVYPNMVTWGFTPASTNGIGFLAKNRGFVNPVNAIGIGAHKHYMCLSGGQMVVAGSSSQFGDYSFWSEGFTQRVEPVEAAPNLIVKVQAAADVIIANRAALIDDVWSYLQTEWEADTWPTSFKAFTDKDTGLLLDALTASFVHGFQRPMLNFTEGMFDFVGNCVYAYAYHDAFKASWDRVVSQLLLIGGLTTAGDLMLQELINRLKQTTDSYWFEVGEGPEPEVWARVRKKFRSLISAINHQWTAPMSGVEYYRVPPSRASRLIQRSIVQRDGGKVRFSGQDDAGNALFVGGLRIDARSGELGGPPFDRAVRGRVSRAVISGSF